MIDRDQLTEALDTSHRVMGGEVILDRGAYERQREAARLLLDFPTDEMVAAIAPYVTGDRPEAALEAVRQVMLGGGKK